MDHEALLELAAEMGCRLMSSGAEIYRVEESMDRLLRAYGLDTAEVFALPACLVVSAVTPEGRSVTRMRRIPSHGTDLEMLERCNALCRRICSETPAPAEAAAELRDLEENTPQHKTWQIYAGYMLAPVCFVFPFGGTVRDLPAALLAGLAIALCWRSGERGNTNAFFRTAFCAAAASVVAAAMGRAGLAGNPDAVSISALMLLVPGMALTNAMREIMAGDTISGVAHITDTILTGAAIALGAAAGLLVGGILG